MNELSPERQELQRFSRERVQAYINLTAIHEVLGAYENDDDPTESKN